MQKIAFTFIIAASIIAASGFWLVGCNENGSRVLTECNYETDNVEAVKVSCTTGSLPTVIDVEEAFAYGNSFVAVSRLDTFALHSFRMDDFSAIDKFGRRGQGAGEMTSPDVLIPVKSDLYIIDSSKGRMLNASGRNDTIELHVGYDLMNMPREISMPVIGYYRLSPQGRELRLYDVKKSEFTDSLALADISEELKKSAFFWASNGSKIALVMNTSDLVATWDVNDGKLSGGTVGRGNLPDGSPTFSSVQCLDDCFLALTDRNVDTAGSEVIVFGYDCKPRLRIKTGKRGRRIVYDRNNNRIVMLAADDDCLYMFDLPKLES